jgi:hypothetical protein
LLESIIKTSPDEELSIVLEEARRRREALNSQIAAALARGRQFLDEGSPAKAVEFLQAQPTAYRRSDQFRDLVQAAMSSAAKKQEASILSRPVLPQPILPEVDESDAPDPSKTMMWNTMGPPVEDEREVESQIAPQIERPISAPPPRVPTGRVIPTPPPPVLRTGFLQRLTSQQKLLAGVGTGVLLLIVLLVALWPSSKKTTTSETHTDQPSQPVQPNPVPPTPVVAENGTLTIQTNVDSVDVFVDKDPKRTTDGKQLRLTLPVGDHSIRVSKDGYNQQPAQTVPVGKNQLATTSFNLVELTGHPGFLEIKSTAGAAVRVDGKDWGTVGQDGKLRIQVDPKSNYQIQVTAANAETWTKSVGPVKADQTLPVTAALTLKALPTVAFFNGPSEASAGQSVKVFWATTNAKSVDIENVGQNLSATGQKDITVNETTTYKLVAKGDGGVSAPTTLTITVKSAAKPPVIASFKATPARIQQGDSTTLTWSTTDAQSVSIDNGVGGKSANGSAQVSPAQSTTYNLTATGSGGTANYTTSVTVEAKSQPAPPTPTPTPAPPTPSGDAAAIATALNRLSAAYSTQLVDEVKKEWTGMSRDQEKLVKGVFSNQGLKAIAVQYDNCNTPTVSGDTAIMNCTETMSYTADKKLRKFPSVPVSIRLKKTSGVWRVEDKGPGK